MHWVTNVKYIEDYKLEVTFNDDTTKIIDMKRFIGGDGVFKPLEDIEFFKKVKVDSVGTTICWENGADIDPDTLYEIGN